MVSKGSLRATAMRPRVHVRQGAWSSRSSLARVVTPIWARSASASCDRPSWWRSCRILRPSTRVVHRSARRVPSETTGPAGEAVRHLSVMTRLATGSGARRCMSGVHAAKVAHQEPVSTSPDDIPRRHTGRSCLAAHETEYGCRAVSAPWSLALPAVRVGFAAERLADSHARKQAGTQEPSRKARYNQVSISDESN
jgi:hypothetical protein